LGRLAAEDLAVTGKQGQWKHRAKSQGLRVEEGTL